MEVDVSESLIEVIAARAAQLVEHNREAEVAPWVDVEGIAKHLNCSTHRIYRRVTAGELPHRRDGKRLLFRKSEVDAALGS